jgi:hypothetical protein
MSAIVEFVAPAEMLFQPAGTKSLFANREPRPIRASEQRIWKLSAQAASPKFAVIESFVLGLFVPGALVGVLSCFAELAHLLDSDAIGHVAMRIAAASV